MIKYLTGYIFSIVLTLVAFALVSSHSLDESLLTYLIIGLALIQLVIQLNFFLHIGEESSPRWNLIAFMSTVFLILLIVVGSLWIMNNLNYNHMTSEEQSNYILHDEGIHK
jgi:cytochrome o ubiquinol oxidase operon protein cyoD